VAINTSTYSFKDSTIMSFEKKKYLHNIFYGNDPHNPEIGDIILQVLTYKSNCIRNKNRIIGVVNSKKLDALDGDYYINTFRQEYEKAFNELINKWSKWKH